MRRVRPLCPEKLTGSGLGDGWAAGPPAPGAGELRHRGQRRRGFLHPQGVGACRRRLFPRNPFLAGGGVCRPGPCTLRHHRPNPLPQCPAHCGQPHQGSHGSGPQRKPHQRLRPAEGIGAPRGHLPHHQRHGSDLLPHHPGAAHRSLHRGSGVPSHGAAGGGLLPGDPLPLQASGGAGSLGGAPPVLRPAGGRDLCHRLRELRPSGSGGPPDPGRGPRRDPGL